MVAETSIIIGGFISVLGAIWAFWVGFKGYIDLKYEVLSQELAEVVLKLADDVASVNIDPPNPVQMLLMQMMANNAPQNRGEGGLFAPKED